LSTNAAAVPSAPETIECPLCSGLGELSRPEILSRLGVRDFARVAQLSAEEAFRLFQRKHVDETQKLWTRFETELAKQAAEAETRHRAEHQALLLQNTTLSRRVEDHLREVVQLRERNQELEIALSKTSRVGKLEEADFAQEARSWAGISVESVSKNGDFILAYRDPSGAPVEPRMVVDNKNKSVISESDIDKLVRDARERSVPVAVVVARTEEQLRQVDKDNRWSRKDGIWVLRTTRQWLPRDLDVLKALFERMRIHGSDFLERNAALAHEIRRTFGDLDRIEAELKKAAKAVTSASGLVSKYRIRLEGLCENATTHNPPPVSTHVERRVS
jgi:hypothetical protein